MVSGLISKAGPPGQLLAAVRDRLITLVTSREQLAELRDVLGRERLRPYISIADARDLLATIDAIAVIAEDLPEVSASPDPKDNPILATAIAGEAEFLVSGDKGDLLALGSVQGIGIITAVEALARLQNKT
nr:putative toxin-antitoxin system toxin component, PIN family [Sphingobium sp. OAS761]